MVDPKSSKEVRLNLAVKAAKIGIWEWDIDTGEVYWSPETRIIFGVDVDKYVPSYESYASFVFPDDLPYIENKVAKVFAGEAEYLLEHRIIRPDGSIRWLECHGEVMRHSDGKPAKLIGTVQDVSQSIESKLALEAKEQDLKKAQKLAGIATWYWDFFDNSFHPSDELFELYGLSKDEYDGRVETINDRVLHPDDRETVLAAQEKIFVENKSIPLEFRIIRPDGEIRTLWGEGDIQRDEEGKLLKMYGTVQDITDRKVIQTELRELKNNLEDLVEERTAELEKSRQEVIIAKNEAEEANNAKSAFLSRMSHELRTPLNAILGFSQLITFDDIRKDEKQVLKNSKEIIDASEYLLKLINEILDLSRIESGETEISLEPLKLKNLCDKSLQMLRPIIDEMGVNLSVDLGKCESINVLADQTRIQQVMANIVSNAVKYNKQHGEVKITCSVKDNNYCLISVVDTGIGMSEETLKELFVPFKRFGAEEKNIQGTGIGLVISKQLIELMGGEIYVESEENLGSTFSFTLPIANGEAQDVILKIEALLGDKTSENVPVVMYVEDNLANLRLMETIFETLNSYKLISARSIKEAHELLDSTRPDLFLIDIDLPDGSGMELLRNIRKNEKFKNTVAFAVSANATALDIKRGLNGGFEKYITKPLNINEFCGILHQQLG